jgi:hypothetical protein
LTIIESTSISVGAIEKAFIENRPKLLIGIKDGFCHLARGYAPSMFTKTTREQKRDESTSHWSIVRDSLIWAVGTSAGIFVLLRIAPEWGAALGRGPVNPWTTFVEFLPIAFATYYIVLRILSKLP